MLVLLAFSDSVVSPLSLHFFHGLFVIALVFFALVFPLRLDCESEHLELGRPSPYFGLEVLRSSKYLHCTASSA